MAKKPLTDAELNILNSFLEGIERDMRAAIRRMTPEELAEYIEDERQEATPEQFEDFMRIVMSEAAQKAN